MTTGTKGSRWRLLSIFDVTNKVETFRERDVEVTTVTRVRFRTKRNGGMWCQNGERQRCILGESINLLF